jgi:hypothetical protein
MVRSPHEAQRAKPETPGFHPGYESEYQPEKKYRQQSTAGN